MMGFYIDFEALNLYIYFVYNFLPMICNVTTSEKKNFKRSFLVRKIEGHNCCVIFPVAQGYQSDIRLI